MSYTCPYCGDHSTITAPNRGATWQSIAIDEERLSYGHEIGLGYVAIACPNSECQKMLLEVRLTESKPINYIKREEGGTLQAWQLLPESNAKPQPSYIPKAIVDDYTEVCRIVKLSPKASATLARRCLQGMIRDFWKIRKAKLSQEIEALKDNPQVGHEAWKAIDAVRSVGNIGAHMEKDVNVIVDIEPKEAELLIGLIEDLLTDWYVAAHERKERYTKIVELATEKDTAKKKPAAIAQSTSANE